MNQPSLIDHVPAYVPPQFDAVESERHRDAGVALAADNNAMRLVQAKDIARELWFRLRRPVSMDDVILEMTKRHNVKTLGNAAGSVFAGRDWKWSGEFTKSIRINAHRNLLRLWIYIGEAK
jgi:hypothetical protein